MDWDSPQRKAAYVSGENRRRRAQERKDREALIAAAPMCGYCEENKSVVGTTVDDKPICRGCFDRIVLGK